MEANIPRINKILNCLKNKLGEISKIKNPTKD